MSPASNVHARWRRFRSWLLTVGTVVAVQSITITPPITVRFVEAESGSPISQLPVTAVWRLDLTHPGGSVPSSVLKVQRLATGPDGAVRVGLALMLHAPNFPFGLNMRRASSLPKLYVVDERYEARLIANDPFDPERPAPFSVLSLQRTSINGSTTALSLELQGDAQVRRNRKHMRSIALSDLHQAEISCGRRWLCQED